MEWGFPSYLTEGRIAMETLFIAPFVSSISWLQKWEEGRENMFSQNALGLKGRKMSRESWNEVRELVKEGESPYKVGIEGGNGNGDENEMVLEWNGIPVVRVSVWMYTVPDRTIHRSGPYRTVPVRTEMSLPPVPDTLNLANPVPYRISFPVPYRVSGNNVLDSAKTSLHRRDTHLRAPPLIVVFFPNQFHRVSVIALRLFG
ncbi:hypothetical protein LXL04_021637 [Taraxacum kok-saghyz]